MNMNPNDMPERPSSHSRSVDRYPEDETPQADTKQRLIMLGVVIAVAFFVVMIYANFMLVPQKAYNTDITNIVNDITEIQKTMSSVKDASTAVSNVSKSVSEVSDKATANANAITNINNTLGQYAKNVSIEQVNSAMLTLRDTINGLQTQINNVKPPDTSTITAIQKQISDLDARITNLETIKSVDNTKPKNVLSISVKTLGNNAFSPIDNKVFDTTNDAWANGSGGGYDGLQGSMRITLNNTTTVDVEDAVVTLEFTVYPPLPAGYSVTLSGGGVPWHKEWSDTQFMEFYNGAWGLSVPAGQTTTINLTLTIQGRESDYNNDALWDTSGGYYYQLQADVN